MARFYSLYLTEACRVLRSSGFLLSLDAPTPAKYSSAVAQLNFWECSASTSKGAGTAHCDSSCTRWLLAGYSWAFVDAQSTNR